MSSLSPSIHSSLLAINGGSSSIKFSLFAIPSLQFLIKGELEGIGSGTLRFHYQIGSDKRNNLDLNLTTHSEATHYLIDWLEKNTDINTIAGIGHRIVQGMSHIHPELISPQLLVDLKSLSPFDPEHLPMEISLIEIFLKGFPKINQVACFDTEFHSDMPLTAKLLPIPLRYFSKGIHRYGFHGLSYAYLFSELKKELKEEVNQKKIILAHLGSGASITAIENGKSIDTSMGFTPNSGFPMSNRSGDLDPGLLTYIQKNENLNLQQFTQLFSHESGLLGLSETSSDMRELKKMAKEDKRARDAINVFCYQVKKWIGSFSAALSGLDILVFSGGIGENDPEARESICHGLEYLGIDFDKSKNESGNEIISSLKSRVMVRVIKTQEEIMIARMVGKKLGIALDSEQI